MKTNKTQKGITLIALIITVIVLLILAGTAVTIAVNGGDIFTRTNDAKSSWNAAVAREEAGINQNLALLDSLLTTSYTAYSVGDTVTLGTGANAETFYVIEDSDENTATLKLITAMNVDLSDYKQKNDAGTVPFDYNTNATTFSNDDYDDEYPYTNIYSQSKIKTYVDAYKAALEGRIGKTVTSARLMTLSEILALGAVNNDGYGSTAGCTGTTAFVNATKYWLDAPSLEDEKSEYFVWNDGVDYLLQDGWYWDAFVFHWDFMGLRPVIEISKSII